MTAALAALAPIALTIAAGALFRRSGLIGDQHWRGAEQVSYYILFPAIIIHTLATADFGDQPVVRMGFAIFAGLASLHMALWLLRPPLQGLLRVDAPAYTSVFQGAGRWHTFVGLAVLPALYGPQGLALGAIATLGIVPLSNAGSVVMLARHGARADPAAPAGLLKSLASNPFLIAIAMGGLIRASGVSLPASLLDALELCGRGALGLALLSVGAGLRFGEIAGKSRAIVFTIALKLAVLPVLMFLWCQALGVSGLPLTVAVLAGAMPTSSAAYILARQMGGDAPLIANIMSLQVLCAGLSLPAVLWILG